MIPYVISTAYPDYKRPCLYQDFGTIKEYEIDSFFLDKICDFILERTDIRDLNSEYSILEFFNNYYSDTYMDNAPWDATIFINNEWENATPSTKIIWEHIQLIKHKEETEYEPFKKENIDFDEDDKKIETQMIEYFKEILNEEKVENIEELLDLNQYEMLLYIFKKLTSFSSNEKYARNRELFRLFFNLCFKYLQKDIQQITYELSIENNEEQSIRLKYLTNIYGEMLEYKNMFRF